MNNHLVYFFPEDQTERTIRGSATALDISQIVIDSDDLENNECCSRISPLYENDERFCISTEGQEGVWEICDDD